MHEEIEPLDPEVEQARLEERLQMFGSSLAKTRDEWIRSRASIGLDKRWQEDQDLYNCKDATNKQTSQMMTSVEQGFPVTTQNARPSRSTVFIGMTRQKTNAAEARLADILLPMDDRNWSIEPTPEPQLVSMSKSDLPAQDPSSGQTVVDMQTGAPLRHKDIARGIMDEAREAARAMQTLIEDQLTEADYLSELRKMIHDAAVLGTGVIKGPIVTNRTRKAWQPYTDGMGQTVHTLTFVEELNPATFRVDPRNIWPDPAAGESIHHGSGIFERTKMTRKQVRALAKQPGYMADQLRKVLEEGPQRSATMESHDEDEYQDGATKQFEVWEYWGEVDFEDLKASGVEIDDEDPLEAYSGCVVMINKTVVKVFLNPLEDGELPYDFFTWERVAGTCWGYGIPYLMKSQQKVLNAAWRMVMDNAGVSSGPQIVIKPGSIQPADKRWELSSRKIWFATEDIEDIRKAFTTFEFNSHQGELSNIIKMAAELADQETGVPMLMQGEKGSAPETVGGMQILMNNSNVILRRLVKQFDDTITKPHIRRYYNFNMMYSDKEDVKGDFSVFPRGSSSLMVRDVQNQGILNLLAAGANPVYGQYLDTQKLFERALQAQHIDPTDVFKSETEIEQMKEKMAAAAAQGGQIDPRVQAAQIRAQTEMQKVQAQNQGDMAELQTRMQIAQTAAQVRMQELQAEREIEMLKMANRQNLTLEQIKANLAQTAIRERGKKELFAAESRLKLASGSGI